MKHNIISQFMMLKDGEVSFGTIVKLIAGVAIIGITYTSGYFVGDFRELDLQLKSKYVHQICIEKQDYLKCREYIYNVLNMPSRFPAQ